MLTYRHVCCAESACAWPSGVIRGYGTRKVAAELISIGRINWTIYEAIRFLQRDRPGQIRFRYSRLGSRSIVMGPSVTTGGEGVGSEVREQRLEVDPAGAQSEVIVPLPEVVVQVELADEAAQGLEPLPERCSAEDGQVPAVQTQPDGGSSAARTAPGSPPGLFVTFSSMSREPSRFRHRIATTRTQDCWPTIRPEILRRFQS
jgi:hypothetical protein